MGTILSENVFTMSRNFQGGQMIYIYIYIYACLVYRKVSLFLVEISS